MDLPGTKVFGTQDVYGGVEARNSTPIQLTRSSPTHQRNAIWEMEKKILCGNRKLSALVSSSWWSLLERLRKPQKVLQKLLHRHIKTNSKQFQLTTVRTRERANRLSGSIRREELLE